MVALASTNCGKSSSLAGYMLAQWAVPEETNDIFNIFMLADLSNLINRMDLIYRMLKSNDLVVLKRMCSFKTGFPYD